MTRPTDLTGRTFGRLTAVTRAERSPTQGTMWLFKCACGTEKVLSSVNVVHGTTKSCGCLNRESASKRSKVHGMTGSKVYHAWQAMRERCKPTYKDSKHYHAKGIKVCPEWSDFQAFYAYIGDPPTPGHTVDRIDGTLGYQPGNVRWATWKEQQRNKSNVIWIPNPHGLPLTLSETLEKTGVPMSTYRKRLDSGWTPYEAAYTQPYQPRVRLQHESTSANDPEYQACSQLQG